MFFKKKNYVYSNLNLIDMLPIGTIVELNDRPGKFMIANYKGFIKSNVDRNTMIEVDYWCTEYPIGYSSINEDIPIQSSDIKNIVFMGYNSKEREQFLMEVASIQER